VCFNACFLKINLVLGDLSIRLRTILCRHSIHNGYFGEELNIRI